jgi:hypothetical protein
MERPDMFVSVKARVFTDATGVYTEMPALLTPSGAIEPLIDYFLARTHDRSITWMAKVVRAVRMFLEFLQSNPHETDTYQLFRNFAQRLYTGTCDHRTGLDPSGLCWSARSPQDAANIIACLTDFFDWLSATKPAAATLNPRYAGSLFDRMIDDTAYQYRRSTAFLGHVWAVNVTADTSGHLVWAQRVPKVLNADPPAFPESAFMDLLLKGFKIGDHYDYRNMLITLLLHGAGFRASEPFHLYIEDVLVDPANAQQAMVRIHHPAHGMAPFDWRDARGKKANRATYLAEQFGLVPRNQVMDAKAAGWKGGMCDAPYYKQAHWFPLGCGETFMRLWRCYLDKVSRIDRPHPFAFVNLRREPIGEIYCLAQYCKAHEAACKRIGLTVAKELGTTPHGHRHAYGRRLRNAGIERSLIRRCMHHASLESQAAYTEATAKEMRAALEAGTQRLSSLTGSADLSIPI